MYEGIFCVCPHCGMMASASFGERYLQEDVCGDAPNEFGERCQGKPCFLAGGDVPWTREDGRKRRALIHIGQDENGKRFCGVWAWDPPRQRNNGILSEWEPDRNDLCRIREKICKKYGDFGEVLLPAALDDRVGRLMERLCGMGFGEAVGMPFHHPRVTAARTA